MTPDAIASDDVGCAVGVKRAREEEEVVDVPAVDLSERQRSDSPTAKHFRETIEDASNEFLCPITYSLPLDPVIAEDGRVRRRLDALANLACSPSGHI